jgi:SAM-dependent methyltransferase
MHDNSLLMFERYARQRFAAGMRVLEIGGTVQGSSYRRAVDDPSIAWETLDMVARPGVSHVAVDEYHYPLPDDRYDVVLSGQVAEHVRQIWRWMAELRRIVKPGGLLITISPVSWPYHEAPCDCWRLYPQAMSALCESADLQLELCQWESLEAKRYPRVRPGRGRNIHNPKSRKRYRWYRVLSLFGYPVEVAYDMLSIARKPAAAGGAAGRP